MPVGGIRCHPGDHRFADLVPDLLDESGAVGGGTSAEVCAKAVPAQAPERDREYEDVSSLLSLLVRL